MGAVAVPRHSRLPVVPLRVVPALVKALRDNEIFRCDESVRFAARQALTEIGRQKPDVVLEDLLGLLRNDDRDIACSAALALGEIGPAAKAAIPILIAGRGKNHEWLGECAIKPLHQFGALAVPVLIDALDNPNAEIRKHAVYALYGMGPTAKPAVKMLIQTLCDKDPENREGAAAALGDIGGPRRMSWTRHTSKCAGSLTR